MVTPELLAPAGDWECLRAAVGNGADAVYFGLPRFNARMRAENFRDDEVGEVVGFLHSHGVKAYVTLNVLIFAGEVEDAVNQLADLERAGVDAVIVQDVGLAVLALRMFPHLRVHASTQMTVTSPEGCLFARSLGVSQVVLGREVSLRELAKFGGEVPLEVFVHGALCVAYSGQCLTSESLGQRSANRGECAQACRMPYELLVDGERVDLGEKKYLLSPQDLAAVREIPELVRLGVRSFKIEGRLKSPEYVAAVTSVYRRAIDLAVAGEAVEPDADDWYRLEMTFSRGLFSGWMHGVDHQQLVGARYGKKRGPWVGRVVRVTGGAIEVDRLAVPVRAGDGVVFEDPSDTDAEQGGRVCRVEGTTLTLLRGAVDLTRIRVGQGIWKTSDPALEKALRRSFAGHLPTNVSAKKRIDFVLSGTVGERLVLTGSCDGREVAVESWIVAEAARTRPLTPETVRPLLERLSDTPFAAGDLTWRVDGEVIVPISEITRLRRAVVAGFADCGERPKPDLAGVLRELVAAVAPRRAGDVLFSVLCRTEDQLRAVLGEGVRLVYVDYEDVRRGAEAVRLAREAGAEIFLATPRIQKAGESGFFRVIENARPDGVLIRNVGAVEYFGSSALRRVGDFSLNVANAAAAAVFLSRGLERVTVSYDLNASQVVQLAKSCPPGWLELVLHQHMPLFHMEHCVFAAFLSEGRSFLDCGRPCESHRVHLRDRVGVEHPLRADVGCRNTLFNAVAQSGARDFEAFRASGIGAFRVELLDEDHTGAVEVVRAYRALVGGEASSRELWRALKVRDQIGVTRGTLSDGDF